MQDGVFWACERLSASRPVLHSFTSEEARDAWVSRGPSARSGERRPSAPSDVPSARSREALDPAEAASLLDCADRTELSARPVRHSARRERAPLPRR